MVKKTLKFYRMYNLNAAIQLLRPGAKFEITGCKITTWDDPRSCPTKEELEEVMEKIRLFEESINTIWLPEHIAYITERG